MEKKNIDWKNLSFSYQPIDQRYVADYVNGAWTEGRLSSDPMITMSECAGVLQYSQSVFEGLKAYTTRDDHIVCFRPDLNAERIQELVAVPRRS
jgi:branched-chain amino acid aminotransferase